ncbi:uncharacterized protein LOC122640779 [Telopea speciosissima]|uniref:uncharacterized protein LOC122640779 n=1 Tax=Telopea speciosissima TaxID=54955 RepID=UPI001CC5C288|nr:uncharacterized protein LOC122640779 [Telopea speciosissima]XP_043689966.1 uncharacterized protein LOC122640779 [Telopea speciosissima]
MASRVQRRVALPRKFKLLRSITQSKSVRKNCIILDALNYINQLKIKLEALNLEYANLIHNPIQVPTEVKVEKIEKGFLVGVKCQKGKDLLVSILEALEVTGLNVVHAKVSCNNSFCMEAIAEAQDQTQDAREVHEAVFNAIAKHVDGGR